jgi:hypothetical protein
MKSRIVPNAVPVAADQLQKDLAYQLPHAVRSAEPKNLVADMSC